MEPLFSRFSGGAVATAHFVEDAKLPSSAISARAPDAFEEAPQGAVASAALREAPRRSLRPADDSGDATNDQPPCRSRFKGRNSLSRTTRFPRPSASRNTLLAGQGVSTEWSEERRTTLRIEGANDSIGKQGSEVDAADAPPSCDRTCRASDAPRTSGSPLGRMEPAPASADLRGPPASTSLESGSAGSMVPVSEELTVSSEDFSCPEISQLTPLPSVRPAQVPNQMRPSVYAVQCANSCAPCARPSPSMSTALLRSSSCAESPQGLHRLWLRWARLH